MSIISQYIWWAKRGIITNPSQTLLKKLKRKENPQTDFMRLTLP